ncbi:MAG: hypothetical protein KAS32_13665 [Candidatus Peribacteraceae bacterium]|nr:hypothetical protein [Candidatus Peribacteraceae bacterium]
MTFDTKKLTLYPIQMDDYQKSWGGVDYKIFLMENFPEMCADYNFTDVTDADTLRMLYMSSPDNVYVVSGVVSGEIVFYNAHAGESATLTSFTVSLRKTDDVASNETTLGSKTSAVGDSIAAETYQTYPFFFDVDASDDAKHVKKLEYMLLYLSIDHTGGNLKFSHANDSSSKDLIINIPIL